ncbi:MAG TPA: hypothetical protein VFD38_17175 [Myxococcaceae bacterium]|nr:hypothetical protein [Myxococcaceae bacterium]
MKTWMVLGALAVAAAAHAAGPKKADDTATAERREQMDQRRQMMVTLQLAEALELDDAGTLKLRQTVAQWDAQRAPLRELMFELAQVLRRAAKGDTTAYGQVDQSIQKIIDLRAQMHQIDQKMFQQLSQGLAPQKKAKLALAIARMPGTVRGMLRGGGGGPRGEPDDVQ